MLVGGGIGAEGGDDAVHPVVFHSGNDLAFPFDIVPGLADEHAIFVLGGDLLDAVDGFGEEFFFEVWENYTNGEGLALFEEDGGLVGFIVQFGGQFLDLHLCAQADAGVVVEGPGYGGGGYGESSGYLLDCCGLIFFHTIKIRRELKKY